MLSEGLQLRERFLCQVCRANGAFVLEDKDEENKSFVRGIRGLEGKVLTVVHDSEPVVKRTYARAWFKRRGEAAASELRSTD